MDIFAAAEKGEVSLIAGYLTVDPALVNKHREDGWTALHLAAYYGQTETVAMLLAHGADVNIRSTNAMENTPLHAAVAGRRFEVVQVLLENGIDVNAAQHGGWTALQGAANHGDSKLVELLLNHGADSGAVSENGSTALSLAAAGNHTGTVELLSRK
ncbi:MAG: ankyrin repeat domain-containing protein [Bryobacteraceae bacterium]